MLIASIVAIVFLTAINYYGTMPIKAMYVVLPVLAVYYLCIILMRRNFS